MSAGEREGSGQEFVGDKKAKHQYLPVTWGTDTERESLGHFSAVQVQEYNAREEKNQPGAAPAVPLSDDLLCYENSPAAQAYTGNQQKPLWPMIDVYLISYCTTLTKTILMI